MGFDDNQKVVNENKKKGKVQVQVRQVFSSSSSNGKKENRVRRLWAPFVLANDDTHTPNLALLVRACIDFHFLLLLAIFKCITGTYITKRHHWKLRLQGHWGWALRDSSIAAPLV